MRSKQEIKKQLKIYGFESFYTDSSRSNLNALNNDSININVLLGEEEIFEIKYYMPDFNLHITTEKCAPFNNIPYFENRLEAVKSAILKFKLKRR